MIGSCEIHQIYEHPCADCSEQKMVGKAYANGDCKDVCKSWRGSQTHTVQNPHLPGSNSTIDLQKNWTHKSYQFWADGVPVSQYNGTWLARTIQVDTVCQVHAREIFASQYFCPSFGLVREDANVFFSSSSSDLQTIYTRVPGFITCFDKNGNDIP